MKLHGGALVTDVDPNDPHRRVLKQTVPGGIVYACGECGHLMFEAAIGDGQEAQAED